jgi:hypothetical protein
MKTCKKCGQSKSKSDFYKHNTTADGLNQHCKACFKIISKERRVRLRKDPNWLENEILRVRLSARAARADGRKKKPTKEQTSVSGKRWRVRNPEKQAAHIAVNRAVKRGKLTKAPCVICGSNNSQAHHEDYSKPLDVIWLCRKHHAERHIKLKEEARKTQLLV